MSYRWSMLPVIAVAVAATPLAAQSATRNADATSVTPAVAPTGMPVARQAAAPVSGAARYDGVVGVRARPAVIAAPEFSPAPVPAVGSRGVPMMIVGGVALIVGAAVGGDSGNIIMVGGAVIGLIGLWNFVK